MTNLIPNFRPIPTITVANDYWENKKWRFNVPEITIGAGATPEPIVVTVSGIGALTLVNAIDDGLLSLTLFGNTEQLPEQYLDTVTLSGGCEQRNIPSEYTQVNYVTNTARTWLDTGVRFDFSKNYEIEFRVRGTVGSWYILQARGGAATSQSGVSGSQTGNTIILGFNGSNINTSQISRIAGNIYYVKGIINNGNLTLYVKDETAGTEETVTGTYTVGTGQSVNIGLLGNGVIGATGLQAVDINSDVYFARIKEDGNYILNYVSCRQRATAGFYDKASSTFKTTTNLVAGTDVTTPSPDTPMDIICNNGVLKVNRNLYSTEYHDEVLSQTNGVTTSPSAGVNVSAMVDCRAIKSFKITTVSPQGSFRIFKYGTDNTFINATSVANIGNIVTVEDSVGFFRIQYNYTSFSTNTENVLIYDSAYGLNEVYADGTQEVVTDNLGNTANAEMLLRVDDYQDVQSILDGSVTRKVGIRVLKGTDADLVYYGVYAGHNLFYLDVRPDEYWIDRSDVMPVCSHYNGYAGYAGNMPDQSIRFQNRRAGTEININRLYLTDDRFDNLSDLATWLTDQYNAGTPVIIVYPLAEATTESVSGQLLQKSPVTQTAGSISNLPVAITESQKTVPTPQQPLQINCNNGVLGIDSQGNITVTGTTETVEIDTTGDTATAENLFKVGTYQDVQSVLDGGVTRNVGIKVLKGADDEFYVKNGNRYYYAPPNVLNEGNIRSTNLLCSHFLNSTAGVEGDCFKYSVQIYFYPNMTLCPDATAFKQWVADQYNSGNPVVIVYPLAEPTAETVTAQPMNIQAGTNIVQITQASMDDLELEVKYKAGVSVTITEIENAQLDDNVEVTIQ